MEPIRLFFRWFIIRRVCAWCKTPMGGNPMSENITHGICRTCFERAKSEIVKVK